MEEKKRHQEKPAPKPSAHNSKSVGLSGHNDVVSKGFESYVKVMGLLRS